GEGPTLLRGDLRRPDGSGVEAATVAAATVPSSTYRTDATGRYVLIFPDTQASAQITVRVTLADGTQLDVANVPIEAGHARSLQPAALRGVGRVRGVAVAGARVSVSGSPSFARTGSDGGWSYWFALDQLADTVAVTAVLPDGRSQTQGGQPVQPRST